MSLLPSRRSFWLIRWCFLAAVGVGAPSVGYAADPLEQLRDALKPELQPGANRSKMIEAAVGDLKTIAQLRRAYFLKQWTEHFPDEKVAKMVDRYREEVGAKLTKAIQAAAQEPNIDKQLAVAVLIAEMTEGESQGEKYLFARGLTDATLILAAQKDLALRQAGLSALGKITPDPAKAFPVLVQNLKDGKGDLGPRRIAAWALSDLVKNVRYLNKADERTATIKQAIDAAVLGLREDEQDVAVRGYCLQAIQESANAFSEHYPSIDDLFPKGKKTLRPELQEIMKSFQSANARLAQAFSDPQPSIRLAALQALDQVGAMRAKIILTLQDEFPAEKRPRRADALKPAEVPDPLGPILQKNWQALARLLKSDDVRFRRGAISFLEQLGDQAEPAHEEIASSMADADRFVRWTATRAMRNLPADKVSANAIRTLGTMLIDPDPDLSKAAAEALEALGPAAHDAVDWLGFVIANGDTDSRNWDAESRLSALKALITIGSPGRRVIPKVLTALADPDVRVRRDAAYALERLGRPTDASVLEQELAALRKALSDEDPEVRRNASEAILTVAPTKKPL